jgi:hypothetical protein
MYAGLVWTVRARRLGAELRQGTAGGAGDRAGDLRFSCPYNVTPRSQSQQGVMHVALRVPVYTGCMRVSRAQVADADLSVPPGSYDDS